jgi:hypothetical protein
MPATSPAFEPEPPAEEFGSCAICGRTILRGERLHPYIDAEGETAGVCALCKAHAEAAGWVSGAEAATFSRPPAARRRPGRRLRERLGRQAKAEAPPAPGPPEPPPTARLDEIRPQTDDPPPAPAPPSALELFNASSEARKVAGLTRTLGEPRVTVRSTSDGELVTVAWELSWYQWLVSDGAVSEVAKGGELTELPIEDRDWNASLGEDGQLLRG